MAEISREQIVAIAIRGLRIAPRSNKLFDLAEDPWIRAGSAPNHYGVAACLAHHTQGIFGRPNITIADHGYANRLLDGANQVPIRRSAIALRTRSGVYRNSFHADRFRHAGNFYGHDALLVPAGPRLDRQRNAHGAANGAQQLLERAKVA